MKGLSSASVKGLTLRSKLQGMEMSRQVLLGGGIQSQTAVSSREQLSLGSHIKYSVPLLLFPFTLSQMLEEYYLKILAFLGK